LKTVDVPNYWNLRGGRKGRREKKKGKERSGVKTSASFAGYTLTLLIKDGSRNTRGTEERKNKKKRGEKGKGVDS